MALNGNACPELARAIEIGEKGWVLGVQLRKCSSVSLSATYLVPYVDSMLSLRVSNGLKDGSNRALYYPLSAPPKSALCELGYQPVPAPSFRSSQTLGRGLRLALWKGYEAPTPGAWTFCC